MVWITQLNNWTAKKSVKMLCRYILSIQNIRNTFLILNCTPLGPQNTQFVGAWTLRYWKPTTGMLAHVDADACVMLARCPFGRGPFLINMGNCWAWKTQHCCRSWHTQTSAPGTYYHTQLKGTLIWFPIHPLNRTHTQSISQLSQGLKIFF